MTFANWPIVAIAGLATAWGTGCASLNNSMSEDQINAVMRAEFPLGMKYREAWDHLESLGVTSIHHGTSGPAGSTIRAQLPGSGNIGIARWSTSVNLYFDPLQSLTEWSVSKHTQVLKSDVRP